MPNSPEKMAKRRRIAEKLERMKKGWENSGQFIREKRQALRSSITRWADVETSGDEPNTSAGERHLEASQSSSQKRLAAPSPMGFHQIELSNMAAKKKKKKEIGPWSPEPISTRFRQFRPPQRATPYPWEGRSKESLGPYRPIQNASDERLTDAKSPVYSLGAIVEGSENEGKAAEKQVLACNHCTLAFKTPTSRHRHVQKDHPEKLP